MSQVRIGMLTPSSNTVLEPMTTAILSGLPEVTAHFGRFPVTEISARPTALGQFDDEKMLAAARMLGDARVNVIAWNGTSAGWLGFEKDRRLCDAIRFATGIPAVSSVLAFNEIFDLTGVSRFALVSPYITEIQDQIVANYARAGYTCVAERHLGESVNFAFADISEQTIRDNIRAVAAEGPDAICIYCTNLRGAAIVAELEADIGIPIYDSVATAVWQSLRAAGVDSRRIEGWGHLFEHVF